MFGFLTMLTRTQKKMGTKILTFCIWCRCGLSQNVRGMVPWWWMHMDLMDIHLMHRYQGGLVGQPPCFGDLECGSYVLVTISKLLLFTCFNIYIYDFSMFLFLSLYFTLHVINTSLDVVFVKTWIYTCTYSEPHLIHICLHFIVYLYSLYAHI